MRSIDLRFEHCLDTLVTIQDSGVDLLLQDIPWGATKNDWDTPPDLEIMWPEWLRVTKQNGAMIFFVDMRYAATLIQSMKRYYRYDIIWKYSTPTGFLNANKMPLRTHQIILVFYRKLPTYNPQKTTGHPRKVSTAHHRRNSRETTNYGKHELTSYDSTERYPTSVIEIPTDKQKTALHPTQKPEALIEWLILTYSNEGEIVCDGYVGSGTTPVACIKTNRAFIGSENKLEHFETATFRIEKTLQPLTNQTND